jgi:hypothetical protein
VQKQQEVQDDRTLYFLPASCSSCTLCGVAPATYWWKNMPLVPASDRKWCPKAASGASGLSRAEAAIYIGVGITKFDALHRLKQLPNQP